MEQGGRRPPDLVRLLRDLREAGAAQRTPVAVRLTDRGRRGAGGQQTADLFNGSSDRRPEVGSELDLPASPRGNMEDGSLRHGHAEHLLQAEALRAGMEVVVLPLPPRSPLVLDGIRDLGTLGGGPELDYIRSAGEPQPVREQRETAHDPHARPFFGPGVVHRLVCHAAPERQGVLLEDSLDVDERAPPRAEGEMVEG